MRNSRVGIIGAGNVGATVAYSLAMRGVCHEIILRDNNIQRAKGMALDMSQASNVFRSHTIVSVADDISELTDCDVIVVTAGSPRLPGMSRDDLLFKNASVMREIAQGIKKYSPNAIVIVVTNPLDAMVYVLLKETGWHRSRIIGMAGVLDSARMAYFIYEKIKYAPGQIRATVMGGHGNSMVPLPKFSTVAGVPLTDILSKEEIEDVIEKTRNAGGEIVSYLKKGSAYYAPAKATSIMVEAILKNTKQIYPCAVKLEGEYGYDDVVNGVPVILDSNGASEIITMELDSEQEKLFAKSVNDVKLLIQKLKKDFYN